MMAVLHVNEDPRNIMIEKTLPLIANSINGIIKTANATSALHLQKVAMLDDKIQDISRNLTNFMNRSMNIQITYPNNETHDITTAQPTSSHTVISSAGPLNTTTHHPTINSDSSLPTPYRMSRGVNNCVDLVKEWFDGLHIGGPSIQSLDAALKSKWRKEAKERSFYCRRKIVIEAMQQKHRETGASMLHLANQLDAYRNLVNPARSLDWLANSTGETGLNGKYIKNIDQVVWGLI